MTPMCPHGVEAPIEGIVTTSGAEAAVCICCRRYEVSHGSRCVECLAGAGQTVMFMPTERPELYGLTTQAERVRDGLAALETHELDALRRGARRAS